MTRFLTTAAALLAAAPAAAQVMKPSEYVMTAGASDLYERQSSALVLQSTTDPRIRAYAQEMIADHARSTADVKAAAARARIAAPPPALMPLQAELIAELRAETGSNRDALYVAQQRASHNQALFVQQAYAAEGTAAPLRAAAGKIVPVVQHHVEMLKAM